MQKFTVSPLVDLTSAMTGTTAPWYFEVSNAYVNGVLTASSWADGILSIPSYTSGVVLAEFTMYLLYDAPSQFLPKDPTDPGSDLVYWEDCLASFISFSSGIKNFEAGITEISVGSATINVSDATLGLLQQKVVYANKTIRIYNDDVITFKGISTKSTSNDFRITLNIQKRITIMDSECSWGDPAYLNRISLSSNTAYYNGANIPTEFDGYAIPMIFGEQSPYEQTFNNEIDLGTPSAFFLIPPSTKATERNINSGSTILRIIPTSSTTGIIGRMPNYQSLSSVPINQALTGQQHVFSRFERASNATVLTKMIPGEVCNLVRTAPPIINPARLYGIKSTAPARGYFNLGVDDVDPTNYDTIQDCDEHLHFFSGSIPNYNWGGTSVLSGTFTPNGHRWITCTVSGIDLLVNDLYLVITNIAGARSGPEVLQFAMESHGFSVDTASFAAMAALFPELTYQQAGYRNEVPTLGRFISEINQSLMTVLVFPASNDVPYLVQIDPTTPAVVTIDEYQIAGGVSVDDEYRNQGKNVIFRPKYAKSDAFKTALYTNIPSTMATLFNSEKTIEIDHVLAEIPPTRFSEIADIYGSPTTTVSFVLLDDSVEFELADMVQINHSEFQQKVVITSIATRPLGRSIQGRFLYVNQN